MDQPLISVIIPLFNKEKSIQTTIQSVLGQSYVNFEIIVVNDGSTDTSEDIVRAIKDERIRIISQENKGISGARNAGIFNAKGKWILFLDADDTLLPDALEILVSNIINDKTIVAANFYIRQNNNLKKYLQTKKTKIYSGEEEIYKGYAKKDLLLRTGSFIMPSTLAQREPFNEKYNRYEDLDFLLRNYKYLDVLLIPDPVMIYETSFAQASKIDLNNWGRDYSCHLPFYPNSFWKNLMLGEYGFYAYNAYPNRKVELSKQYKDYQTFIRLAKSICYYQLIMNNGFEIIIRKMKKIISSK